MLSENEEVPDRESSEAAKWLQGRNADFDTATFWLIASLIGQAVAEARADEARKCAADVCPACGNTSWHPAQWKYDKWMHLCTSGMKHPTPCAAAAIHERLSLKGGEGKEPK